MKREAEKKENAKIDKLEKQDIPKKKSRGSVKRSKSDASGIETSNDARKPSKKKSLIDEERILHEAYQMILGEHHKKVRQRMKLSSMLISSNLDSDISLSTVSNSQQRCPCLFNQSLECNRKGKEPFQFTSETKFIIIGMG